MTPLKHLQTREIDMHTNTMIQKLAAGFITGKQAWSLLAVLLLAGLAPDTWAAEQAAAENTESVSALGEDGLQQIRVNGLDRVYARPDADLSGYTKVLLPPVSVAFRRNWGRGMSGSTRVSSSDAQRIKDRLAALIHEEMVSELARGGYQVVDTPGDDVLEVRISIENLNINAPDVMSAGRSRTYALSVGEMTLEAELRDSTSGDLIARIHDRHAGRQFMSLRMITRADNVAEARNAARGWGAILRNQLDLAKQIGAKP
jgi:hypothetical protein